jgi:hypothetical protein
MPYSLDLTVGITMHRSNVHCPCLSYPGWFCSIIILLLYLGINSCSLHHLYPARLLPNTTSSARNESLQHSLVSQIYIPPAGLQNPVIINTKRPKEWWTRGVTLLRFRCQPEALDQLKVLEIGFIYHEILSSKSQESFGSLMLWM